MFWLLLFALVPFAHSTLFFLSIVVPTALAPKPRLPTKPRRPKLPPPGRLTGQVSSPEPKQQAAPALPKPTPQSPVAHDQKPEPDASSSIPAEKSGAARATPDVETELEEKTKDTKAVDEPEDLGALTDPTAAERPSAGIPEIQV